MASEVMRSMTPAVPKSEHGVPVLASMAMGFLSWFVAIVVAPDLPGDLLGLLAALVTLLVVSPLTQKIDPPRPLRNNDGEVVEFRDRLGSIPIFGRSRT